ncbi:MAG: MATE family efflux transporter [Succinivibrio sp.]|nr:MATE family efflux transporter [Succinivibrio sp.]
MVSFLERSRNVDMLHGTLWDKLLIFSFPLALTTILQQLFNTADVVTLGNFVSAEAMAAVGNNVPIIGLVVNLFVGLSIGTNVVVARYIGMGDPKKANDAVHVSILLAVLVGILVALAGEFFCEEIIELMEVPDNVKQETSSYMRYFFIGIPFISINNFEAALFRAKGDTVSPLLALFWASLVNIAGNLLSVLVLDAGIEGVAVSTTIANGVCSLYLFYLLRKDRNILHVTIGRLFYLDTKKAWAIIAIGLPSSLQFMVFSLSNLVIQSAINSLGSDTMAASVAAFTIEINIYAVVNAFGLALTTFIGQNYGAGNLERCRRVFWVDIRLNMLITVIITLLTVIFARNLLGEFTDSETVIAIGMTRILYVAAPQPIGVIMESLAAAMRGYGYSLPPALASLIVVCGVRLLWVYTEFQQWHTFEALMVIYPVSWILNVLFLTVLYIFQQKSIRQKSGGI